MTRAGSSSHSRSPCQPAPQPSELKSRGHRGGHRRSRRSRPPASRAAPYFPREVFLTFDVFFVADFATGFSGVPAASALSFCFLVAIPDHDFPNSRFQNGTAFVSLAGVVTAACTSAAASFGSPLGVSVMVTPSILRTSRLDGDVNQTITTGLKRHSIAHALP